MRALPPSNRTIAPGPLCVSVPPVPSLLFRLCVCLCGLTTPLPSARTGTGLALAALADARRRSAVIFYYARVGEGTGCPGDSHGRCWATILAAATAVPELATGLTAVRNGEDELALGDIFGGNAFLPVLFLLPTPITGQAILPRAQKSDIYLAAVGILLTVIYLYGLLFRPQRRVLGLGLDSFLVVVCYLLGIVGLFAVAQGG